MRSRENRAKGTAKPPFFWPRIWPYHGEIHLTSLQISCLQGLGVMRIPPGINENPDRHGGDSHKLSLGVDRKNLEAPHRSRF
jgi:hypothetical protein